MWFKKKIYPRSPCPLKRGEALLVQGAWRELEGREWDQGTAGIQCPPPCSSRSRREAAGSPLQPVPGFASRLQGGSPSDGLPNQGNRGEVAEGEAAWLDTPGSQPKLSPWRRP